MPDPTLDVRGATHLTVWTNDYPNSAEELHLAGECRTAIGPLTDARTTTLTALADDHAGRRVCTQCFLEDHLQNWVDPDGSRKCSRAAMSCSRTAGTRAPTARRSSGCWTWPATPCPGKCTACFG